MTSEITGSRLEGTRLIIETTEGEQVYDSKFLVAALLVITQPKAADLSAELLA